MNYYTALYKLYPNVVSTYEDEAFDAEGNEVEIDKSLIEAEVAKTAYIEKRRPEYPSIGDQLDDLFRSGAFSDEMRVKIQAVKDKYPKS